MVQILYIFLGVFFGLYSTFFLVETLNIFPVVASSFIGLVASGIFRVNKNITLLTTIYCGSFAGMNTILYEYELVLIGIVTSVLFIFSRKVFQGFGGKLGFIAYTSSILSEIIILIITFFSLKNLSLLHLNITHSIFNYSDLLVTFFSSISGFYITIFLHHKLKTNSVFASAFPSLMVGIMSIYIPNGIIIASTFFSASFLGMIAENKVKKKHCFFMVLLHFIITMLLSNNLSKYGGALGTIAFITAFIAIQIDVLINSKTLKKTIDI